ncbi:MAG TPA: hypothetical protein VJZ27_04300, partial [Aggregatilineales bacterium]|nr:hypothetical protein [Aggregatilineales bacterium]
NWESYSQSQNKTINSALTVTGTDTAQWQTDTLTRESIADYDLTAQAASGTVSIQRNLADSDNNRDSTRDQIQFIVIDGAVFVASGDNEFAEVTGNLDNYAAFELETLTAFDPSSRMEISTALLDHVTAVFDLGVGQERNGDQTQRYQVELDFAESVPELDFNLDAFVNEFNGIVELRTLTDAIIENSSLILNVSADAGTDRLKALTLVLEIPVQIEGEAVISVAAGNGIFELAYGQQQGISYFNINEAFEIEAP